MVFTKTTKASNEGTELMLAQLASPKGAQRRRGFRRVGIGTPDPKLTGHAGVAAVAEADRVYRFGGNYVRRRLHCHQHAPGFREPHPDRRCNPTSCSSGYGAAFSVTRIRRSNC
jgi:hypothetical protein